MIHAFGNLDEVSRRKTDIFGVTADTILTQVAFGVLANRLKTVPLTRALAEV
jgi:hypothetical protein